jgi:hypothetical protein
MSTHARSAAGLAVLLLLAFASKGWPVPFSNEYVYLVLPLRHADPGFLARDWTLATPWDTHLVFNAAVGSLARWLPIEAIGWGGRLLAWAASLALLVAIGERFGLPRALAAACVGGWLALGQSVVGGEWIVGAFEAKCVAYVALLAALLAFAEGSPRRERLGAVGLGLAVAFHAHVGVWGSVAAGIALLAVGVPLRRVAVVAAIAGVLALPGLVPALLAGGSGGAGEDVGFVVRERWPHHLDPLVWPKRELLALATLFAFDVTQTASGWRDRAVRLFGCFEIVLMAVFAAGLLVRFAEGWRWLQLTLPFRLAPLFTLLFFGFHVARVLRRAPAVRPRPAVVLLGLLALASLRDPIAYVSDRAREVADAWLRPRPDVVRAFDWIARNTPPDAIVVAPPTRREAWYVSRRAQIVAWWAPAVGRLDEWQARIEALVGRPWDDLAPGELEVGLEEAFNRRSESEIRDAVERYGGDVLVSRAAYGFPVLFDTGSYRVYDLAGAGGGGSGG